MRKFSKVQFNHSVLTDDIDDLIHHPEIIRELFCQDRIKLSILLEMASLYIKYHTLQIQQFSKITIREIDTSRSCGSRWSTGTSSEGWTADAAWWTPRSSFYTCFIC